MEADSSKRRRDEEDPTSVPEAAPAPAKPRRRRFDDGGSANACGPGGATAPVNGGQAIQADIAKLQQQVAAMHALASVPEDQRAAAVRALQEVIAGKQAELAKLTCGGTGPFQGVPQSVAAAAAMGAGLHLGAAASGSLASRIYVGSMPYEATEHDMRALFSQFGQIIKIDMSFEPLTGKTKGYCFISYDTPEAAQRAITQMNGAMVGGRAIKVNKPNAPGSGPAAPIPTSIASIMAAGQQAASHLASSWGVGFSGLGSAAAAPVPPPLLAYAAGPTAGAASLLTTASAGGSGGGLSAEMLSAADEAAGAALRARSMAGLPSFRVFVGSVPFEISAENIKQIFGPFGNIRSVSMLPSQEPGNSGHRGYGFIEFDNEASGRAAIDAMNGFDLGGRKLKVSTATSANAPGGGLPPMFATGTTPAPAAAATGGGGAAPSAASILTAAMGGGVVQQQQQQQQPYSGSGPAPLLDNIAALAASAVFGGGQGSGGSAPAAPPTGLYGGYAAAPPPLPPAPPPPLPTAAYNSVPTRVVAIHNMATAADLSDPELEGDILGEAAKCGTVTALRFERHPADANRVTVFLAFGSPEQAAQAAVRLNARFFGGQVTSTALYPQAAFDAGDFVSAL